MQKELKNIVEIPLDGRMQADLNWKEACEKARLSQGQGVKILWQLELGLFKQLTLPLANQTQFNALFLSLEHFRDTIWPEFEGGSLGLCICRSNADFSLGFQWDEEQVSNWRGWLQDHSLTVQPDAHPQSPEFNWLAQLYCRDAAAEYFHLLAANLTDSIPLFISLDGSTITDPVQFAMLTTTERFEPFRLIIQGGIGNAEQAKIGICLPSMHLISPVYYTGLGDAIDRLIQQNVPFRIIPEYSLINQWDGLDHLVVVSASITPQGRRKLQGFCAAGGTILNLGEPLGLPYEIPYRDFY